MIDFNKNISNLQSEYSLFHVFRLGSAPVSRFAGAFFLNFLVRSL